ncbi:MAG: DUF4157 domain-containing protein [bacterium]|nr:DUF4157 domain-containing protein [bacterium]
MAEKVMRTPDSSLTSAGDHVASGIDIRRIPAGAGGGRSTGPDIKLSQSGGHPLSASTRSFSEPRFGTDFGRVRLHADQNASETAAQIQAKAFTYGHHVWLGSGTHEGDGRLMAHELTHVVQQGAASPKDRESSADSSNDMVGRRVQRARLPCTSQRTIDVYQVSLPGSTRTLSNDLANANSVLCQCGIKVKDAGGQSVNSNVLNLDPPLGALNSSGATPSREFSELVKIRPGGDVIHAYYVPAISGGARGSSIGSTRFSPSLPDSVIVANSAVSDTFAHELGHVLMDSGAHHGTADNLMASGTIRNVGVDELEQTQCNRM